MMEKIMWRGTVAKVGSHLLSYLGYHPKELVFGNRVATPNYRMGYPEGKLIVNF